MSNTLSKLGQAGQAVVIAYCVAWTLAILFAANSHELDGKPAFAVLWVDGLHVIYPDDLVAGTCAK